MKSVRKILSLSLALSLIFALCGCASGNKPDEDEEEAAVVDDKEGRTEDTESSDAGENEDSSAEETHDDDYAGIEFESSDVFGARVDQEIFRDYDVTVVNIWATYCGPCINEMPELARWYDEMPDNVNIIGIVSDVYDPSMTSAALDILDDTGVKYPNVILSESLYNAMLTEVYVVPTTFLVSRDGTVVAGPIEGAYVDAYKQTVDDYLEGLT